MKYINKKNTSFLTNKPFTIFEVKNFLSEDFYLKLYNSFPEQKYFGKSSHGNVIDTDNLYFKQHLQKFSVWVDFFKFLNSKKFINSAYTFALIPNLKSRGLRALKKWTIRNLFFPLNKFYRSVKVETYFTIQRKNEHLRPHTDAPSKLLSMIFYFPDINSDVDNMGTEFWKVNKNKTLWKNWKNSHLPDDQLKNFKNDNELFFRSKFEKNKLVGFVKNDISWHSVLNNSNADNQIRKALVINIREA